MSRERGSILLESLVSAATFLVVVAALLPFLLSTRQLASRLALRAARIDAARLTAHRLRDEARRAGFGVPEGATVVTAAGTTITLNYLDGGFDGGHAVAYPAPAGATTVELLTIGDLAPGQDVVILDVWGRSIEGRIREVDRPSRRVELMTPLPRDVLPQEGARLYVRLTRTWSAAPDGVRRDGRSVAGALDMLAHAPAPGEGPGDWLAAADGGLAGRAGDVGRLWLGRVRALAGTEAPVGAPDLFLATAIRQPAGGSARP